MFISEIWVYNDIKAKKTVIIEGKYFNWKWDIWLKYCFIADIACSLHSLFSYFLLGQYKMVGLQKMGGPGKKRPWKFCLYI